MDFCFGCKLSKRDRKKIFKNIISVTLMTFLFSLFIETAQLLTKVGAFDVDDLFLNTVGGFLGYIFMKLTKIRKHI